MKAKLKSAVATEYRMSYNAFIAWIKEIPNLNITRRKLLSPKQIKMIYEHLGDPES